MRVTWVNPGFLHYRVPVYAALDALLREHEGDGALSVVFSTARTPAAVASRLRDAIGDRAVALSGEKRVGLAGVADENFANVGLSIPYQSGLIGAINDTRPDVIVSEGFFQWTPAAVWVK